MFTIKTKKEIEYMRESCRIVALAQQAIKNAINVVIAALTQETHKLLVTAFKNPLLPQTSR